MVRFLLVGAFLAGCASGAVEPIVEAEAAEPAGVLMVGNSHTSTHGLFTMVGTALGAEPAPKAFSCAFLEDAAANPALRLEIGSGKYHTVVLQGQKTSSSHKYRYSTKEGEQIAVDARSQGMSVFWFAEWSRKGVDESGYIEETYRGMAVRSGGTVIPVGRVFDQVLKSVPGAGLWSEDGNHASRLGAGVAAVAIATWMNDGRAVDAVVLERSGWDGSGRGKVMEAVRAVWLADHPDSGPAAVRASGRAGS